MIPGIPARLDEVFAFFESRTNLEKGLPQGNPNRIYRLNRMAALCKAFDSPQEAYQTVHVAGSKGKGSVAAYTAALLASLGRRVGIYSSPHVMDYRERFRIVGDAFPEAMALEVGRDLLGRLEKIEAELPGSPSATTFELLTLYAFLLFQAAGCDTVVLETGLGGRLDATNVIRNPELVILTHIEKEHTEVLGRRLKMIAAEKAGIIKPGSRVWSAPQKASICRVFRRRCREMKGSLSFLSDYLTDIDAPAGSSPGFTWKLRWREGNTERLRLSMGGRIQGENAALALAAVRSLEAPNDLPVHGDVLSEIRLPGRFQILRHNPLVVLDGAHTPKSIGAVAHAFLSLIDKGEYPRKTPVLLFGSTLGKNHRAMARILSGGRSTGFPEVVITTPGTFKPSDPPAVARAFRRQGARVRLEPHPQAAWEAVQKISHGCRPILITGSFYMAGEILRLNSPT